MTETNLTDFEKSLGEEASFWHDYHLQVASELLGKFTERDWASLEKVILARPLYWQERCAEAIGYLDNEEGVPVLTAFLDSPHMSVAAIAASELHNMAVSLQKTFQSRLVKILEFLKENGSSRTDDVQALIERLAQA